MKIPLVIGIVVFLAAAGIFWYVHRPAHSPDTSESPLSASATASSLAQLYTDPDLQFSFNYPTDYRVRTVSGGDGSRTLLIESASTGNGIQVLITPDTTDTNITAEVVHTAIPDMKIESPQPFAVGTHTGLAFKSDNPAFADASREVWFVSKRYLYQISTYAKNDDLLAALFKTWKLEP